MLEFGIALQVDSTCASVEGLLIDLDSIGNCALGLDDFFCIISAVRNCLSELAKHAGLKRLYIIGFRQIDIRGSQTCAKELDQLFAGIIFPRLSEFFVQGLPHSSLARFLMRHLKIGLLSIGPCITIGPCPIQRIHFKALSVLECPVGCSPRFSSNLLITRYSGWTGCEDESLRSDFCKALLPAQPWISSVLWLELQVASVSFHFLRVLAQAAPQIKGLSLIELPTHTVHELVLSFDDAQREFAIRSALD